MVTYTLTVKLDKMRKRLESFNFDTPIKFIIHYQFKVVRTLKLYYKYIINMTFKSPCSDFILVPLL